VSDAAENTFRAAEEVARVLEAAGMRPVVIGAVALAVHHYPRQTEDVDLAVATEPKLLEQLVPRLRARGWEVGWSPPDAQDPLGGVLTIRAPGALPIQVVNFDNPPAGGIPALPRSAAVKALAIEGLLAADLPHLIAFKLYAGGPKSELDILELLTRNQVDLAALRGLCTSLGLGGELERVLAKAG
jgi:hypothetical protein